MIDYTTTHNKYNLPGVDVIGGLRKSISDNNPYEKLETRSWFTQSGCVYIRKDVDAPAIITYLLLLKK